MYYIDTDRSPTLSTPGMEFDEVYGHRTYGERVWNPQIAGLYFSRKQTSGSFIDQYGIREALKTECPMNANMLDFFLEHPEEIPPGWGRSCYKTIYFFGTLLKRTGRLFVRCLIRQDDGTYIGGYHELDCSAQDVRWSNDPVAVHLFFDMLL
ncbi:hypothetical protein HYV70_05170 [Candidatus Uhrbacteria bacterium]|nr:hypothetical protein [Candidatus Uhrbacteria bacterium]